MTNKITYYGQNTKQIEAALVAEDLNCEINEISNLESFKPKEPGSSAVILEVDPNNKAHKDFIKDLRQSNSYKDCPIIAIIKTTDVESLDSLYTAGINWHLVSDETEESFSKLAINLKSLLQRMQSTNKEI